MGLRQPFAQQVRGLRRRPAVKGHQRGWDAGEAHDVGPPAICGHVLDLDVIEASGDGFFEAM